jgi:hypothetical protein
MTSTQSSEYSLRSATAGAGADTVVLDATMNPSFLEGPALVFLSYLRPGLLEELHRVELEMRLSRGEGLVSVVADPLVLSESTPGFYDARSSDYSTLRAVRERLLEPVRELAADAMAILVRDDYAPFSVISGEVVVLALGEAWEAQR